MPGNTRSAGRDRRRSGRRPARFRPARWPRKAGRNPVSPPRRRALGRSTPARFRRTAESRGSGRRRGSAAGPRRPLRPRDGRGRGKTVQHVSTAAALPDRQPSASRARPCPPRNTADRETAVRGQSNSCEAASGYKATRGCQPIARVWRYRARRRKRAACAGPRACWDGTPARPPGSPGNRQTR